jgi:4,5-dihydroxyphthalate decarboxylase
MKVLPLRLNTVTRTQPANAALKDGTVVPRACAFEFEEVDPLIHAFRRMVRELEYDVCELAITTYMCAKEYGKRFTALPIFLVRQFHHGAILVNTKAGIREPKDLEGRKVGVNRGYTVTSGVWARGILADEYGVDLDQVTWVLSGDEHVAEYRPPVNVVPIEPGKEVAELLVTGELAAAIGIEVDHPDVAPLIPDAAEAGLRALRTRHHYPINHLVVVRDELLAAHPGLGADVYDAFERAKNLYVTGGELIPLHRRVAEITGCDPLPYGIGPNRVAIDELIGYTLEQGILTARPSVETLFTDPALTG